MIWIRQDNQGASNVACMEQRDGKVVFQLPQEVGFIIASYTNYNL